MFPLQQRKLIRGASAHIAAGLGAAADYQANYVDLFLPFDGRIERFGGPSFEGGYWLRLIRPNGDKLEFAHLSKYLVANGTYKAGTLVAHTGNSGTITSGPHLHVQIFNSAGKRLDPEKYDWQSKITTKVSLYRFKGQQPDVIAEGLAYLNQRVLEATQDGFAILTQVADAPGPFTSKPAVQPGYVMVDSQQILALASDGRVVCLIHDPLQVTGTPPTNPFHETIQLNGRTPIQIPTTWFGPSTGTFAEFCLHELLHAWCYLTGAPDKVHSPGPNWGGTGSPLGYYLVLLQELRPYWPQLAYGEGTPMNQSRIVLGKDGKTVFKATPIATDFENFKKQMAVEGIDIPDPIPPSKDL
jgi:hypothetical protein